MIFQLPPAIPPAEVIGVALTEVVSASPECKRNSRDCFPGDLVGTSPQVVILNVAVPRAVAPGRVESWS
ncbi:hypothetical protein [Leptolyngbya sp. KIOST-1]|uniref:hypothetical protein n=1 Tax=Leptolyngbya sp. KIOST-1 TaxID=1229172 RepID=UPI000B17CE76|nr:hypothetical protein [Leptolyngbya sp. KIOST-1]